MKLYIHDKISQSLTSSQSSQRSIELRERGTILSQEQQDRRRFRHYTQRPDISIRMAQSKPLPQRRFRPVRERLAILAYMVQNRVYLETGRSRRMWFLEGIE
jgi:hypothetical protein